MTKLKRNYITLVKEVKEGEVITQTYTTPVFIPFEIIYEAVDIMAGLEAGSQTLKEQVRTFTHFIAKDIYKDQFTVEELIGGLHAPDAVEILRSQIRFVSDGYQSEETKKYMEKNY